uniref:Uncharacterized protein n=1 Tax=Rheinheimera sp. BAL341 TaxID=1708203 RepID=A0A486XTY3_9GAMM
MVVVLSIITWESLVKPFLSFAATVNLISGACTIFDVIGKIVMLGCMSKLSDCTIRAGRGFP